MAHARRRPRISDRGDAGSHDAASVPHADAIHDAPSLSDLFAGRGPDTARWVLDFQAATRRNFESYSSVATAMRFLGLTNSGSLDELRGLDEAAFERRLRTLLPVGREVFDVVLTWTLFDYLSADQPNLLSRHLAAISAPGARLHAMIAMSDRMPAAPDRFEIVGAGRLAYLPSRCEQTAAPGTPPAKIEAWLDPFRVEHAVVLRHGIREVLAILP